MSDRDTIVRKGLKALREQRTLNEEFFDLLRGIAAARQARARTQGIITKDKDEDLAGDFALWLAAASPTTYLIDSYSSLARAYGKWATTQADPEGHELWLIISSALRELETAGKVQRPESQRNFNNQNATRWYLPGNAGRGSRALDHKKVPSVIPKLSRKGPNDRVLKPKEASRIVASLMALTDGELTMKEIIDYIRPHVPMLTTINESTMAGDKEDDADRNPRESMAAEAVYPDLETGLEAEIAFRSERIWSEVGEVSRGTKDRIEGRRILCCYWIPHKTAQAKVTLEEFGSTSTVMDVVKDITAIMAKYVPQPRRHAALTDERSACLRIGLGILLELSGLCSESGFCRAFYQQWDP